MDVWIARLSLIGQSVVFGVCGLLIALGHDSVITDLFCAAGGALVASSVLAKLKPQ